MDVPDAVKIEGSENNPILLDSTPVEHQPRQSMQRRNVGPPKFFGDRRYIDIVLEKDDQNTQVLTVQDDVFNYPRATFTVTSPSDLLIPLAEAPPKSPLSQKIPYSGHLRNLSHREIQTILTNTSFGSSSSPRPATYTTDDIEGTSDFSLTIDTDLNHRLDDFDARFH